MRLLAFETATRRLSAALWIDGALRERTADSPHGGSALVLPWVGELLAEAGIALRDIDAIAFGAGPGAFTGVRLACGVTQGLAFGLDVPVVPVSTLAALALAAGDGDVWTVLDARMGEVYSAAWRVRGDVVESLDAPVCVPPDASAVPPRLCFAGGGVIAVGDGFASHGEALLAAAPAPVRRDLDAWPSATAVARLAAPRVQRGETVTPADAQPEYVRDKVALTTAERLARGGVR